VTLAVAYKLLAIFATVALGWVLGRAGAFAPRGQRSGPAAAEALAAANRVLSDTAFMLFVPALLFRTMARLDLAAMPWSTLAAYFMPALAYAAGLYVLRRRTLADAAPSGTPAESAAPATWTVAATYGNAVQLGVPMASALFGEAGLALHVALVSLHGVVLLTLLTVLAEVDVARADRHATVTSTARSAARNALIHPVVLPVLLGLGWNLTGAGLHPVLDDALGLLASAVVPLCLVLIGTSLVQYGLKGRMRGAAALSLLKLAVLPALVFVVARFGFGLQGLPLGVVVMMAALPTGSNALIFAQRYDTGQAEATAAIVLSTLAFVVSASVWLTVLAWAG
jgi:hypothetical protein